jgi:phosphatidylglycerophosphate synthase
MITSCAISITFDQTLTQDIPRWSFLFSAISIFVYQTLDAIDGKQARRTGSSSPLG